MLTNALSIDEILVDNKYGVAAIMSPRRIIHKPQVEDIEPKKLETTSEIDKTQFIIPGSSQHSQLSYAYRNSLNQIDQTPEVFYSIPLQYKKCSNWGKLFRQSDRGKTIIDHSAKLAIDKLEQSTDKEETGQGNPQSTPSERHSISEAIELAAEQTSKTIENIVFAKQKAPIILIHGFRGAPLGLKAIQDELKKAHYKVYCPEIPPFAGAKIESYTPRSYANYLANYIANNQIHKPILAGHSMGSIIAAATAMHCADLLNKRLILMSPISTKTPKAVAAVSPLQNYIPNKLVSYVTTRFLAVNENREQFKQTIDITNKCSLDCPPSKAELIYATKFSTNYAVSDFAFKKDTLLLAGEKDRLIRASDTTKLAENIGAQTCFLPATGHLHNYEKPIETAQAIINFLETK